VFSAVLIGVVIILLGLAVAVVLRPVEKWGFRKIEPGQPDVVMGTISAVLSVTALGLLFFIPAREGAPPSGKIYLAGMAFAGLSWGLAQLGRARRQKKQGRARID
jgi:hypothetical protein